MNKEKENLNSSENPKLGIPDVSESKLSGSFIIDLSNFEKLSREVGYMNKCANIKYCDNNGGEYYNETDIQEYKKLRIQQLSMFSEMIKFYS